MKCISFFNNVFLTNTAMYSIPIHQKNLSRTFFKAVYFSNCYSTSFCVIYFLSSFKKGSRSYPYTRKSGQYLFWIRFKRDSSSWEKYFIWISRVDEWPEGDMLTCLKLERASLSIFLGLESEKMYQDVLLLLWKCK